MIENIILENISIGILIVDEDLKAKYMNSYMKDIFFNLHTAEEYLNKPCGEVLECIHAIDNPEGCGNTKYCKDCTLRREVTALLKEVSRIKINQTLVTVENKFIKNLYFKIRGKKIFYRDKVYVLIEFQEAQNEENLKIELNKEKKETQKLKELLDSIDDMVFYKDESLKYVYLNKAQADFVGRPIEEIIGKSDFELLDYNTAKVCSNISNKALDYGTVSEEQFVRDRWYHILKGRVVNSRNERGVFGIIKDITAIKQQNEQYREKIYRDRLTGLYNRNFYEEIISKIYLESIEKNLNFTIITLDMDNLKNINDNFGHTVGDKYLKSVGKIIERNIRIDDYGIRIGGDEFMIVILENENIGQRIAKRILKDIKAMEEKNKNISISLGIGIKKYKTDSLEEVYIRADKALYESKKKGKGILTLNLN